MDIKNVILELMKEAGDTQDELAKRLGYKGQPGLAMALKRGSFSVDSLLDLLDVYGYRLYISKKDSQKEITKSDKSN